MTLGVFELRGKKKKKLKMIPPSLSYIHTVEKGP